LNYFKWVCFDKTVKKVKMNMYLRLDWLEKSGDMGWNISNSHKIGLDSRILRTMLAFRAKPFQTSKPNANNIGR
jgi:hypothetical protein